MRTLGIVLIVCGIVGLAYGGFTYTRRKDSVSFGGMTATVTQREKVPVPPILGGIALVAGIAMLVAGGKKRA